MSPESHNPSADELLQHASWIQSLAQGLTADPATADDLIQQTRIAVWQKGSQREGSSKGWMSAILKNFARQDRRSEGARALREQAVARPEALPSGDELLERLEQQQLLVELVRKLGEAQRTVVILHFYEGLGTHEIAQRLGEQPGTIRQRLKRALDGLREELDGRFGGRGAWLSAFAPLAKFSPVAPGAAGVLIGGALLLNKTIAISAVVLALVGGALYWGASQTSPAETVALATPDSSPSAGGAAAPIAESIPGDEGVSQETVGRVALGDTDAGAPSWSLSGRVQWPANYGGEDSRLEVFALDEAFTYSSFVRGINEPAFNDHLLGSAFVAADGRFHLELPTELDEVHLMPRGAYLYGDRTVECRNAATSDSPLLEALAGCWLRGVLQAPTEDSQAELAGIPLRLTSALSFEDPMEVQNFRFTARSQEGGRFEFLAVPADLSFFLLVRPEHLAASMTEVQAPRALELRELRIELDSGGSIEGRVLDAAGASVAGAEVKALWRGKLFGLDDDLLRSVVAGDDGIFRIGALPPGELHLFAQRNGYLESDKARVMILDRQVLGGLDIELSEGRSLSGIARLANGTPAAGAELQVVFDDNFKMGPAAFNQLRGAKGSGRADAEGHFRITGLGAGPFVVTASLGVDEQNHRARLDAVGSGGEALEVTLHPPLSLTGRVTNQEGGPVEDFEVYATRMSAGAVGEMESARRQQSFAGSEGKFELDDLLPGRWHVVVSSRGLAPSLREVIQLPQAAGPREFLLEVPGTISGTVVTPEGLTVAGAQVQIDTGLSALQSELVGGPESAGDESDDLGFFYLSGLRPGVIQVHAKAQGFAWSESVAVEVGAGQEVNSVQLVLRRGGRITGEAYDDGQPAAGRMVNLVQWGAERFDTRMTETAVDGSFTLENVEAGSWQLLVIDNDAGSSAKGGDSEVHNLFDSMMATAVEVREGSEQHVVLGVPTRKPVKVHGRVTRAGEACTDLALSFRYVSSEGAEEGKLVSLKPDGRYETTIDGFGSYVISATRMADVAGVISVQSFRREVPDVAEHRMDFEIPGGGIAGRVVDSEGAGLEGARVVLMPSDDGKLEQFFAPRFIETVTNRDGGFELDDLPEGNYAILAGGGLAQDGGRRARVTRRGLAVDGESWLREVEIQLPEPGRLDLSLVDYLGGPMAGATIFVRDSEGHVIEALSRDRSDPEGNCLHQGLAPGSYWVFARSADLASAEIPVEVRAGQATPVELELEPGSWLQVRTLDRSGEAVGSILTVLDKEGREVGQAFQSVTEALARMDASASGEHLVGPLVAGKYSVQVTTASGDSARKSARLSDGDKRKLTLRPRSR